MAEPKPTKSFRFNHFSEPKPGTLGSDSDSNQVWKIWEPDHGQSTYKMSKIRRMSYGM